jgi:hypothetical protein
MRTPTRVALLASCVLLGSPGSARAEPTNDAAHEPTDEELIAAGIDLRKQGRDAEALATFERAYAKRASPRAVTQIALAHHALAQWREAERGLVDALRDTDDPWIARNLAYLEESLRFVQAHLAWLYVESDVVGAEVWVGGEFSGRLPLAEPLRVVASEVTVEVRAPGYAAKGRTLQVAGNSRVRSVFAFAPGAVPERQATPEAPAHSGSPVGFTNSPSRTAGWITLAGAGALAVIGIGGLVTRDVEAGIWNDDGQCLPPPGQSRYSRCGANRDIGSVAQTIAVGAFVGAGVAVAVSGVLLLRRSRPVPAQAMGHIGCLVVGPGFECGGTF